MKETILSCEFELHDSIYNGVQPLTDKNIEPDITTLSNCVRIIRLTSTYTHVNKIALPDTKDHSIIASGKIK